MAQIQLNFVGEVYQAGIKGLKYAESKDIGVIIMEPLLGGILGENVPEDIIKKWDSSGLKRAPAEWAFRWLGNFKEAIVILSGVSNMEQLKEDIEIFDNIIPNSMSQGEEQIVKKVKEVYKRKIKVNCTGCSYCMPCPSGVNIPEVFWHYNKSFMSNTESWKKNYRSFFCKNKADASQCSECGQCEEVCPQNIAIIDNLKEAHKYLMS
jgi:predicted aldo/keto reductase-like oxidoreductase